MKINKMPKFYMIAYLPEKINKIPEFYMIYARKKQNARILHDFCPKNFFPVFFFWGGGQLHPVPRLLRL